MCPQILSFRPKLVIRGSAHSTSYILEGMLARFCSAGIYI
jgi:hypothetical protein